MTRKFRGSCAVAHGLKQFDDRALFEEHMLVAHDAKPGMAIKREEIKDRRGGFMRYGDKVTGWCHRSGTFKKLTPWRAPRLTENGKPFEPRGFQPGAVVTWREYGNVGGELNGWVERSGQVWCEGWRPRSAWVVPFERRTDEQGHLELAVMIEQRRKALPDLEHYSTQWSSVVDEPKAIPA